jgi:hypothetical protein
MPISFSENPVDFEKALSLMNECASGWDNTKRWRIVRSAVSLGQSCERTRADEYTFTIQVTVIPMDETKMASTASQSAAFAEPGQDIGESDFSVSMPQEFTSTSDHGDSER